MEKIHFHKAALPLTQAAPLAKSEPPARKLRVQAESAAQQFETLMALQMVKSMQKSLDSGSLLGNSVSGDVYNGLAEWELAKVLAQSAHFGVKEQILRQLPGEEER
jgi:Rod binding domain-containing protein